MKQSYILLRSIRDAIKAEAFCRNKGIANDVVPVPRQISSECGMCLRVSAEQANQACSELQQAGFKFTFTEIDR